MRTMYFLVTMVVVLLLILFVWLLVAEDNPATPGEENSVDINVNIDVDEGEALAGDIVDLTVDAAESSTNAVDDFLERLITTPQSDLMRVLLVVGGALLLVAGWRVYDFIVIIAGFIVGAAIALSLVTTENTFLGVGAILLGGVIGAALSVYMYLVGIFLIGAYIGIVLTGAIAAELSQTEVSSLLLFVGGLIGAFVLLGLSFEFLIFVASIIGAQMLTLALQLDITWTIILAIIGIVLQLGYMRRTNYSYRRRPQNPLRRVFA